MGFEERLIMHMGCACQILDPKKYVKECSSAHVSFQRFSDTLHACFTHFARIVLLVFVYKSSVDCKSKRMVWVCLRTALLNRVDSYRRNLDTAPFFRPERKSRILWC